MQPKFWKTLIGSSVFLLTLAASVVASPVTGASARLGVPAPGASSITPSQTGDQATASAGLVPPQHPSKSLSPTPNFLYGGSCKESALDDSGTCNTDVVKAINDARSTLESMPAFSVNLSAFEAMTVPQQIFVATNLERTDRGLTPVVGLTTQLDNVAQTGAADNTDPNLSSSTLSGGASVTSWGSIWAGGTANPLGSDYYWMYDDGTSSPNGECTTGSESACWGHRNVILGTFTSSGCSQPEQYMGTGYTASGSSYGPAFAGIVVGACGPTPTDVVFTWAQAEQDLKGGGGGTGTTVPGAPQDVRAASSPKKGVVLSWQAPASNGGAAITGYEIFRGRSAGTEKLYATVTCTTSTCSYTNRHAHSKKMFFYQVAAENSQGTGPWSTEVSAQAG